MKDLGLLASQEVCKVSRSHTSKGPMQPPLVALIVEASADPIAVA